MFLRRLRRFGERLLRGGAVTALAYIMTGLDASPAAAQAPPEPPATIFEAPQSFETQQPQADLVSANGELPNLRATNAALEARLQALEQQFSDQQMKLAADEKASAEPKDPAKGVAVGSDTKMNGYWKQ